jgi:tetratricopeptide (TPR) repeat protein
MQSAAAIPPVDSITDQSAELAAMRCMLEASRGVFSLSIAICNSPGLRDYLISRLREFSPTIGVVSIPKGVGDPFQVVEAAKLTESPAALFVTDLERLLSSQMKDHPALRSLNASRELWERHFRCPVVFWLPEYAAALLSTQARDFWRYRSHRFEFVAATTSTATHTMDRTSDGLSDSSNLSQDEKHFRIAKLEQRLKDADVSVNPELAVHALHWLNELGSLHYHLGNLDGAKHDWARMQEFARSTGSESELAIAYGNLGVILRTRGNVDEAEAMYRQSLAIDQKLGRLEGMAYAYGNLGNALRARGDLEGAEAMYRKSLAINEKLGRLDGVAYAYGSLGTILESRGNLGEAEAMHRKSLAIHQKLGGLEDTANAYCNLGNVLIIRGDLDEAEAMHRKSLAIHQTLGGLEGLVNAYGNLGNVLSSRGNLEEAEAMYRKSLAVNEKLGRVESMATAYGNLGAIVRERGDLDGAEAMYRKSLEIEKKLGRSEGMAYAYGNLGIILLARGDLDGAKAKFQEAFEIMLRTNGPQGRNVAPLARNLRAVGGDPIALARGVAGDEAADILRTELGDAKAQGEARGTGKPQNKKRSLLVSITPFLRPTGPAKTGD